LLLILFNIDTIPLKSINLRVILTPISPLTW